MIDCIESFRKIEKYTGPTVYFLSSIAEFILSIKSSNAREVEWFFRKPYWFLNNILLESR
jgi:hypothetical protein